MAMSVTDSDANAIIESFIKVYGFVYHVISSMNDAYSYGIETIIKKQFPIEEVYRTCKIAGVEWTLKSAKDYERVVLKVIATNVEIKKPCVFVDKVEKPSYPVQCKKEERLYGGMLEVEYQVELIGYTHAQGGESKTVKKGPITFKAQLGKIPICVMSNRCNITNFTTDELDRIGEDPNEFGGYIIDGSNSYLIDSIERTNAFNRVNTYYEGKHKKILCMSNLISKPGINYENSIEIKVVVKTTKEIVITITKDYFNNKEIPFFVFFRLLDVSSDQDIVRYVLRDDDIYAEYNKPIFDALAEAFLVVEPEYETIKDVYDPVSLRKKLAFILAKQNKAVVEVQMLEWLDKNLLPHMGNTSAQRFDKMMFLGYMIKKTLMVSQNPKLNTSRDQLEEKLVQAPGTLFCDTFKKLYNNHFISFIKNKFRQKLKQSFFENIDLNDVMRVIVANTNLEAKLVTTLSSGVKDPDTANARYSTQKLYPHSDLSRMNAARTVRVASSSAHSKKNRSKVIMETRPSYIARIDPSATPDTGDGVGKIKSLSITCLITNRGDLKMQDLLLEDIITLDQLNFKMNSIVGMGEVFFNGKLLGYHENICVLRNKYVQYRRSKKIDRFTGIHCHINFNNIDFRTDASRLVRPLIIVYNSFNDDKRGLGKDGDLKEFKQWTLLTPEIIKDLKDNTLNIDDLRDQGVIEWVDLREEIYSCYVSNSLDNLYKYQNDPLNRYTHVDLMASLYGLACLSQPFGNFNPDVRTTFHAKMKKQALSRPTLERKPLYSDMWTQTINTQPLATNIMDRFTASGGASLMIAICSYRGHNQEDSVIINDRLNKRGLYYMYVDDVLKYVIEPNEVIAPPDEVTTEDLKEGNYNKLKNGLIVKGTIITHGDILVCRRIPNKRGDNPEKKFTDRSIKYTGAHDQMVMKVFFVETENERYLKIHIREHRPIRVGEKVASLSGQKGIVSKVYPHYLLPFNAEGVIPDLLFGPHGLPTRKTMGLLIEGIVTKLNAFKGVISDHTIFGQLDIKAVLDNLKRYNVLLDREVMYDGVTGERMETTVVCIPNYYQRIHKSVYDRNYAKYIAKKDEVTRQARQGQKQSGGLRFAEMEMSAGAVSGATAELKELFTDNADGFITFICQACGSPYTVVNERESIYTCKECSKPSIIKHNNAYTSNLVLNIMTAMGVRINFETD